MTLSTPDRKSTIRSALGVCAASCALTIGLLAAVYALRGIWPFGGDNVAYADTAQFYVPGYYQLWDVLHGRTAPALSWFSGLAENRGAAWQTLLSPSSLVFLLVARDHVLEGLSLYLGAKLLFIAMTASLTLSFRFPRVSGLWRTALTLLYTFCGFVLQYYSNFSWLTVAAAFPVLLFGLERLLREGRWVWYVLAYGYLLYCSVYYAYMATIYVLLFAFGYILLLLPRERRGDRALRLGAATALALGLSAYFWLSSSSGIAGSSRFQSNMDSGLLSGMSTWNIPNIRHTILMLLGMSPVFALLAQALSDRTLTAPAEQDARRQTALFFAYMLGMLTIPMVFTNIDTAWHFGQYNFFPMRYGYMLPATLIAGAALALDERSCFPAADIPPAGRRLVLLLPVPVVLLAVLLPRLTAIYQEYGAVFLTAMGQKKELIWAGMYLLAGLAFTALYFILLRRFPRAAAGTALALVLLQTGVNAYGLVAPSDDHTYTREYDPAYIEAADALYDYFSGQDISPLSRTKNVDSSLNAGYPAIAGVSALSSVASGNSATRLGVFRELGYTVNYFRLTDVGGTVFTDMLLGVDRVLSVLPLDEDLYLPGDTVAGVQVGRSRYPGVIGLMYDEGALDDYFDLETLPDRLNALYRAFTGSEGTIAYAVVPDAMTREGDRTGTYTLTCTLERPAFLYASFDGSVRNITAGGKSVAVPTYLNLQNGAYPAAFNSNLLSLGLFGPGPVEIQFTSPLELDGEDIALTALDKRALDGFADDASLDGDMTVQTWDTGLSVTVTADRAGRLLFLPLCALPWEATVNGREVQLRYPLATAMAVPLEEGENTVVLTRTPERLTAGRGLYVSCACLVLGVLGLCFRRRLSAPVPRPLGRIALWLFYGAAAVCFCFVYIAPTALLLIRGTVVWFR